MNTGKDRDQLQKGLLTTFNEDVMIKRRIKAFENRSKIISKVNSALTGLVTIETV